MAAEENSMGNQEGSGEENINKEGNKGSSRPITDFIGEEREPYKACKLLLDAFKKGRITGTELARYTEELQGITERIDSAIMDMFDGTVIEE